MKLREVCIAGFKSIGTKQTIAFGDVNVLLGANGSGKSNLVSFFQMLNFMTTGALQVFVGKQGASRILHYGPRRTETLEFSLRFQDNEAVDTYEAKLSFGQPDRLFFSSEKVSYHRSGYDTPYAYSLGAGGGESALLADTNTTSRVIINLLSRVRAYQFHDTSDTSWLKGSANIDDAKYLRSNAGNLAAFLRMLKGHAGHERYYQRIVRHIQTVMPQFGDFVLEPSPGNEGFVRLNWTDSAHSDYLFDPGQLSDGSLRFMALAALLLQPPSLLPRFIVLDEPELGLHPTALSALAAMIKAAATHAQIMVATQSTRLVDEFVADQVIVVEHRDAERGSAFKRLDSCELAEWLARYSLSELWEKNILGGQP